MTSRYEFELCSSAAFLDRSYSCIFRGAVRLEDDESLSILLALSTR